MSKDAGTRMAWPYLWSRVNIGYAALREGDLARAQEFFHVAMQLFQKSIYLIGIIFTVEGFASLRVKQGQPERATALFAWADIMREKIGDQRPLAEQKSIERHLAVIHSELNDDSFAACSAQGQAMTIEQAIALAIEDSSG